LREHFGLAEQALARLRGPIGLYIGSKTPSEIAVSIMAEILAVKNGIELPRSMDVAYAKESQTPAASTAEVVLCGIASKP
jgi:xanthine dehydrogenase accessory factor